MLWNKNPNFSRVVKKAYIETTIIFWSIFQKFQNFFLNLKKSAKYWWFSNFGECDGFLLVLKIHRLPQEVRAKSIFFGGSTVRLAWNQSINLLYLVSGFCRSNRQVFWRTISSLCQQEIELIKSFFLKISNIFKMANCIILIFAPHSRSEFVDLAKK